MSYHTQPMSGILDDLINVVTPIFEGGIEGGQKEIEKRTGELFEDLKNSPQGRALAADALKQVEAAAQRGVADQLAQNLPSIIGLTIGGGALGGYFLKGRSGALIAAVLVGGSVFLMMSNLKKA